MTQKPKHEWPPRVWIAKDNFDQNGRSHLDMIRVRPYEPDCYLNLYHEMMTVAEHEALVSSLRSELATHERCINEQSLAYSDLQINLADKDAEILTLKHDFKKADEGWKWALAEIERLKKMLSDVSDDWMAERRRHVIELSEARAKALEEAERPVLDLFNALRAIGGTPTQQDLIEVARRIRELAKKEGA